MIVRRAALLLLLAPVLVRAQAWDANVFSGLKARLAEFPAPASPASQPVPAQADPDAALRALFAHPLIAGASVSAGFKAESPGRRAARKLGTDAGVASVAVAGAAGASQAQRLTDENLAAASVVIGADLFFWDSRRDCKAGLDAVDEVFKRLAARKTPAIIGTVPGEDCGLNEKIARACAAADSCAVLDLASSYAKAAKEGADLDGTHYTLRELQPDGLHLSDAGSELMARAVLDAGRVLTAPSPLDKKGNIR